MARSHSIVLEGDGLRYRTASGQVLLDDVSVEAAEGDRLAIIGPNGAGKSTLLRLLSGMLMPASGTARLFGQDVRSMSPVERARSIAVVGQADQPDPRVPLLDYVGLGRIPHHGRRNRSDDRAIVLDALARTGLTPFAERTMGSLSGGERQRAQIARALAQEPRILFLDEPTNHLDPRARADLMRLVADLGLAVVAVLHDLHIAAEFATRIAVIDQGRLVACGTPDATLSRETVRNVFGIDLLRLPHPVEDRHLMVFGTSSTL